MVEKFVEMLYIKYGNKFYNYLLEENLTVNALPDYMLIEFFNWIKINDNTRLNIGFVVNVKTCALAN